jgi:hypothetical protein
VIAFQWNKNNLKQSSNANDMASQNFGQTRSNNQKGGEMWHHLKGDVGSQFTFFIVS